MKRLIESKWIQEVTLAAFCFILFTLNDWILISSWKSFLLGIVYFLFLYAHAQVNRFALLPILLKKQSFLLYIMLSLLLLAIFSFFLLNLTAAEVFQNCFLHRNPIKMAYQYQMGLLLGSLICIIGSNQFVEYYRNQKIQTNMELLFNRNQIDFLNKQLNPHFLFNTLNTIYGVSLKYPSKTPELIMRVSELLRYQVENSKRDLVSLNNEIEFISSYIEIERERLGYRCRIEVDLDVSANQNYFIAPMILFTFIENAFKHGTRNIDSCFVVIKLSANGRLLRLQTSNSLPLKKSKLPSTRVGLENTKQRLDMLYPLKHDLKLSSDKEKFDVLLEINL